jgi:Rrf2 family protein
MKLSTRGRYAVRLMLDLAFNQEDKPVLLREIAGRQEISFRYLEQLILNLKAAGLVKSIRGAKGGFVLARPPSEITLLKIFKASEGSLSIVDCLGDNSFCKRRETCVSHKLWLEMKEAMEAVLSRWTLAKLVEQYLGKQTGGEFLLYNI